VIFAACKLLTLTAKYARAKPVITATLFMEITP
jgi:hypothetical protein